ncbi:MAG: hypothetical protein ACD_44C00481G0001, partial [uncultured bacterium]
MKILIIGADSALSQSMVTHLDNQKVAYVATSRRVDSKHYYLDVNNQQESASLIKIILHEHSDISHLIYTPAISADGITHRMTHEKWTQVFSTNLFGAVNI